MSLVHCCTSASFIHDSSFWNEQSFVEIVDQRLLKYVVLQTASAQPFEPFLVIMETLSVLLFDSHISLLISAAREVGKNLFRNDVTIAPQVVIEPGAK